MLRRTALVLSLFLGTAVLTTACTQSDPSTPQYWIEKLSSEARKAAIKKLGEMEAKEAVAPLIEAYEAGRYRYDIVAALARIGDKAAVETLVKAVADLTEPKAAQLAAATLKEWGMAKGQTELLVSVILNPKAPKENLYGALELFALNPTAKAIPGLMRIVEGDPELQPIVLNGLAAESLGKLGVAQATDALIKCLWLDDPLGRNAVKECRLALNRIGPTAVLPKVLETMARKNTVVEKRARKFKYNIGGAIEFKMAEMLGDMPDPRAVDLLIDSMVKWEDMPAAVQANENKAKAFISSRIQKVISSASALAAIGDAKAVKPMLTLANSDDIALEFRLAGVQQLSFLGSEKAIPGLMKMMKAKHKMFHFTSHGLKLQVAISLGRLIDGSNKRQVKALSKMVSQIKGQFETWAKQSRASFDAAKTNKQKAEFAQDLKGFKKFISDYAEVEAAIAATSECGKAMDCWSKKLGDKSVPVRLLAGYRLAQAKGDAQAAARKALAQYAGDEDLVVRNVILFGLRRVGDKTNVAELEKHRLADLKRAENRTKRQFKGAAAALELTIAQLQHR